MAKKLAQVDAQAMNSLYASEITRMGVKVAADDKGAPQGEQALKDHSEYLEIIKSVLSEDSKTDFSPNDPVND